MTLLIKISQNLNNILIENKNIIKDILQKYNKEKYKIEIINKDLKNIGNYTMQIFIDEFVDIILFNNINNNGRNSRFIQFLPPFITNNNKGNKYFYIINYDSNDNTDKSIFIYSVLDSVGIKMFNCNSNFTLKKINTIDQFMNEKACFTNAGNHSTTIKKNIKTICIHGKSGGAETGELLLTSLFCLKYSEGKKVKLYQYNDKIQNELTSKQIDFLKNNKVEIVKDARALIYLTEKYKKYFQFENHRNQRLFIKNLLKKFNEKKCLLCTVKNVIASHIERQSDINNNTEYSKQEKEHKSVSPENGFWLCRNHDILFEKKIISFNDYGDLIFKKNMSIEDFYNIKDHIETNTFKTMKIDLKHMTKELCNQLKKHRSNHEYVSFEYFNEYHQFNYKR